MLTTPVGLQVLVKIVEAKQSRSEQAQLFIRMNVAQFKLALGDEPGTKALIEAGTEELATLNDVRTPRALTPYILADPGSGRASYYEIEFV